MENGKIDVMGINIDISQVLGQKIVDQYIAQLSEDEMQKLLSYISSDLFEETSIFNFEINQTVKTVKIKEREKDRWGDYKVKEIPIGELIKNHFNDRIKEELKKKVEDIIASTDYQKKIDEIANELVEYSINGYKEDLKNELRQRLVYNVLNPNIEFGGIGLSEYINTIIDSRFGR
jgi:hypothetical protein